jgi:hypothetical protein
MSPIKFRKGASVIASGVDSRVLQAGVRYTVCSRSSITSDQRPSLPFFA